MHLHRVSPWTLVCLVLGWSLGAHQAGGGYLELGHGVYASPQLSSECLLEIARFDWVYIPHGRPQDTSKAIDEIQRYNPDFKVVYSLRPTHHLGHGPAGLATCLDYCYDEKVRQAVDAQTDETVKGRSLLAKPGSVFGWAVWEELPVYLLGDDSPGWIEPYREKIERERGKPLADGPELRTWIMRTKYVAMLEAIHKRIRALHPEAVIFYHHHPCMGAQGFAWEDIVGKPWCNGLVAHHNVTKAFENWVTLAKRLDVVYFTQLSHPPFMRAQPWDFSRTNTLNYDTSPRNLGYFFYCEGVCRADACAEVGSQQYYNFRYIEDPEVSRESPLPSKSDTRRYGMALAERHRLHYARFCNQQKIGLDVVPRYYGVNGLAVQGEVAFHEAQSGDVLPLRVTVRNRREAMHFLDPADAVAKQIAVRLSVPAGLQAVEECQRSVPELAPGASTSLTWNLRVTQPSAAGKYPGLALVASCLGTDPATIDLTSSTLAVGQERVWETWSGSWLEPNWTRTPARRRLSLRAIGGEVQNVTVSSAGSTLQLNRTLVDGEILEVEPDGTSRVVAEELSTHTGLIDDPAKAPVLDKGYTVGSFSVGRACSPKRKYRLAITGRATGGAGALVEVRFGGTGKNLIVLHNALQGETWQKASVDFEPPEGATEIGNVYLYRLNQRGAIQYGSVSIRLADLAEYGGEGATANVLASGVVPLLAPRTVSEITCKWQGPGKLGITYRDVSK